MTIDTTVTPENNGDIVVTGVEFVSGYLTRGTSHRPAMALAQTKGVCDVEVDFRQFNPAGFGLYVQPQRAGFTRTSVGSVLNGRGGAGR